MTEFRHIESIDSFTTGPRFEDIEPEPHELDSMVIYSILFIQHRICGVA